LYGYDIYVDESRLCLGKWDIERVSKSEKGWDVWYFGHLL
jgi:hypothetical protein